VIAVSEGVKDELIANFGVREAKVRVIYNPIDTARICERASEAPSIKLPKPYILAMGRLVPNKNFRLLIESYWSSGIGENLVILGEGSERGELETLISKRTYILDKSANIPILPRLSLNLNWRARKLQLS
jgi:N-acetylgalactosamine-N,N'-diacetylbacillosaminyl-diphospho-undecaprenol 4-alpha-N-acetylgalactosaminyltransferase